MDKKIIEYRRALHGRAECGFHLPWTREFIIRTLRGMGYTPTIIGKGSILARVNSDSECFVLLRADMDALNIKEETDLPFASTNGCMHACGHDMHAAMLLGAAELLKQRESELDVGVLLLFQAGEECLQGARDVIETGLFDQYRILCSFSIHVLCGIPFKSGTVILPPHGVVAPGADVIKITVRGKASHGSTPHMGASSIHAAADIIDTVNRMLQQEIAPTDLRTINWGRLVGGDAANVVAELTEIDGNLRYYDNDVRKYAHARIAEITELVARASRCVGQFQLLGGCPPLRNDEKLLRAIRKELDASLPDVIDGTLLESGGVKRSLGGSEDFAHFAELVPSVLFSICAGRAQDGYDAPLHNSRTDFDESALLPGARFFAQLPFIIEKSLRN